MQRPKSLVEVHGRPFIDYQLERLRQAGITDVVLCLGRFGEQIERHVGDGSNYGLRVRCSFETEPLGTAGALQNARRLLNEAFFTLYGDSYLALDFRAVWDYFMSRRELALMTVFANEDRFERSNTAVAGGFVTRYSKRDRTPDMKYIDYGVSLFRKPVLDLVPPGRFYSLEELFPRLIAERQLLSFEVRQRFYQIGTPEGLEELRQHLGRAG